MPNLARSRPCVDVAVRRKRVIPWDTNAGLVARHGVCTSRNSPARPQAVAVMFSDHAYRPPPVFPRSGCAYPENKSMHLPVDKIVILLVALAAATVLISIVHRYLQDDRRFEREAHSAERDR